MVDASAQITSLGALCERGFPVQKSCCVTRASIESTDEKSAVCGVARRLHPEPTRRQAALQRQLE